MSVIRVWDRSFNNSWILHHTLYYTKTKIADDITFKIQSGFFGTKIETCKTFQIKIQNLQKKNLEKLLYRKLISKNFINSSSFKFFKIN